MALNQRNFDALVNHAAQLRGQPREASMRRVVDLLWESLNSTGVSWVGFYVDQPERAETERLILGPCRDSPACSPIGLHGVCGQALLTKQTRIVEDVAQLGPNYIACDPRDMSEIVVPMLGRDATCWGVLDLDSRERAAFNQSDDAGLRAVLAAAGLTHQ